MILFIDESGHDHHDSYYEVLGGIAIPQSKLWTFICAISALAIESLPTEQENLTQSRQERQEKTIKNLCAFASWRENSFWLWLVQVRELAKQHFGVDRLWSNQEMKGTKLLQKRRLQQALGPEIPIDQRRQLVQEFYRFSVDEKDKLRRHHFNAYAQSCRFFCRDMLQACQDHSATVLAAMIHPSATPQIPTILRADYVSLFYQLYQCSGAKKDSRSIIIHDERDDSQCRELARQLYVYYVSEGKEIAQRVVPEPLFVKSHLTLGVLVADIIAYILAGGFRYAEVLNQPYRLDLAEFAEQIKGINQMPEVEPENLEACGIVYLEDLGDLQRWSNKKATNQSL